VACALAARVPQIFASNFELRIVVRQAEGGAQAVLGGLVIEAPFAPVRPKLVARSRVTNAHEFIVFGRERAWLGPSISEEAKSGGAEGRELTEIAHVGLAWLAFEAIEVGASHFP
jgi:hypothetical protein